MRQSFGSTHTIRARWVIFAARQFARAWGSPKIRANHLLSGLIAEDQEQLQLLPGLPETVRRRIVTSPHSRLLSAEAAAALMRQIEAGRGESPALPFETPMSMDTAVAIIHAKAARLAHCWKLSWLLGPLVDTKHYWRALLESGWPEEAALLSHFLELGE